MRRPTAPARPGGGSMTVESLEVRFVREAERLWLTNRPLIVALSGGIDSTVLLHLLRFSLSGELALSAAHFDHRMRPESTGDAEWVRGLCRAWAVPLSVRRSPESPKNEERARALRYAFLEEVRARTPEAVILTAHHADDQAETVLFRILRGTGLRGLAGIPRLREPGIIRPLLPFWREEIEDYARAVGLHFREDPTNAAQDQPRAFLRTVALPQLERVVAPGARRSLVRLARIATEADAVLRGVAEEVLARSVRVQDERSVTLDRQVLTGVETPVLGMVLRAVAARLGGRWNEEATLRALATLERPRTRSHVGGGLEVATTPDEVRIVRLVAPSPRIDAETREG